MIDREKKRILQCIEWNMEEIDFNWMDSFNGNIHLYRDLLKENDYVLITKPSRIWERYKRKDLI